MTVKVAAHVQIHPFHNDSLAKYRRTESYGASAFGSKRVERPALQHPSEQLTNRACASWLLHRNRLSQLRLSLLPSGVRLGKMPFRALNQCDGLEHDTAKMGPPTFLTSNFFQNGTTSAM